MKIRPLLLILLVVLTISSIGFAETPQVDPAKQVSGLEWLQMSAGERANYVLASMYILHGNGIALNKSPDEYYNAIEEKLTSSPGLYSANLTNILASIVYEKEPGARESLDQFRKKPEVKKIEMH